MGWISRELSIGLGSSLAVHLSLSVIDARGGTRREPEGSIEIAVAMEEPPPPPPSEATAVAPPETVVSKDVVRATPAARGATPREPKPAAEARAAQTLTAPEQRPDEVADFTMVQGEAAGYAGGTTVVRGTSTTAVRIRPVGARADRAADGREDVAAGPDRSQRASPADDDWSCSDLYPASAGVDEARVTIVVRVRADGKPDGVDVLRDPGGGFGAAVRACALRQRYFGALDAHGEPAAGATSPFVVRFAR